MQAPVHAAPGRVLAAAPLAGSVAVGTITVAGVLGLVQSAPTLPPEIGGLSSLVELLLSSTALTLLPDEMESLHALADLDLVGTPISVMPPVILKLSALESLYLQDTQLASGTRPPLECCVYPWDDDEPAGAVGR